YSASIRAPSVSPSILHTYSFPPSVLNQPTRISATPSVPALPCPKKVPFSFLSNTRKTSPDLTPVIDTSPYLTGDRRSIIRFTNFISLPSSVVNVSNSYLPLTSTQIPLSSFCPISTILYQSVSIRKYVSLGYFSLSKRSSQDTL